MVEARRAPAREIFGWAMFDFANQAYTLLIITVVFGDLFTRVIVGTGRTIVWVTSCGVLALAISYLMVVVANPVCGAVMDHTRSRKRFLFASYLLTIGATGLLYFVEPGWIITAVILIIVSNFAYAIGEGFISSFLPDLGPRDELGWISGLGWSLGYVGGLVATAFTLAFLGDVSAENYDTIRWVGPFAAVFFLVTAIPTFVWLRERGHARPIPDGQSLVSLGMRRMLETARAVTYFRDLRALLVSIFFSMAGIYIIVSFSFIYGSQVIQWDESTRVLMFITVQITAAIGAILFGWLQGRIGAKTTYLMTLVLWVVAILAIWQTPAVTPVLNAAFGAALEPQDVFLFAGCFPG